MLIYNQVLLVVGIIIIIIVLVSVYISGRSFYDTWQRVQNTNPLVSLLLWAGMFLLAGIFFGVIVRVVMIIIALGSVYAGGCGFHAMWTRTENMNERIFFFFCGIAFLLTGVLFGWATLAFTFDLTTLQNM